MLKDAGALDGKTVHRSVFYEITKNAVQEAIDQPREIADALVKAYLARRALDFLVGFNLSPLLWKKAGLSGASAGRVQSPALRMICEREEEIAAFKPREYWTMDAEAEKAGQAFGARLVEFGGGKVEQFTITDGARADEVRRRARAGRRRQADRRKRREEAAQAQPVAALHHLDAAAGGLAQARLRRAAHHAHRAAALRGRRFRRGPGRPHHLHAYRLGEPRHRGRSREIRSVIGAPVRRRGRAGLAAHVQHQVEERAGGARGDPPDRRRAHARAARGKLEPDQHKLYTLIWRRAVASQMEAAVFDTVAVDLAAGAGNTFRANGSTLLSPGFLAVYREGFDDGRSTTRTTAACPRSSRATA